MTPNLFQHVVEKVQSGTYGTFPRPVEVQLNVNAGLRRASVDDCRPFGFEQKGCNFIPVATQQGTGFGQSGRLQILLRGLALQQYALAAEVLGQLDVGQPVAYDQGAGQIVAFAEIFAQHAGAWFAGGGLVGRKGPRSEEHTSELQSRPHLVCRLLLEKKKNK